MERAKRRLFVTSVYIAAIRGGLFSPAFRLLLESLPRTHPASVVTQNTRDTTPLRRHLPFDLHILSVPA